MRTSCKPSKVQQRRWRLGGAIIAVGLLWAATACSSGSPRASSSPASTVAPATRHSADQALGAPNPAGGLTKAAATGASGSATAPATTVPKATTGPAAGKPAQQLAYTASMTVRVAKVASASDRAQAIATTYGGTLFSEQATADGGTPQTTITFKLPPERFRAAMRDLGRLGTVTGESVQADDVTDQVVDLDGRLKTATASADRLRALLDRAAATTDIVAIESELAQREAEIESMTGQLRTLAARVQDATVTVTLTQQPPAAEPSTSIPGFGSGLRSGWVALVDAGRVAATAAGWLVPFVPLVLVAFLAVRLGRRHQRRRRASTTPATS